MRLQLIIFSVASQTELPHILFTLLKFSMNLKFTIVNTKMFTFVKSNLIV